MNKPYAKYYSLLEKWFFERDLSFNYFPDSQILTISLHLNLDAIIHLTSKQLYLLGDFKQIIHTDTFDDLDFSLHNESVKLDEMHELMFRIPCLYHFKITYDQRLKIYFVEIVNVLQQTTEISFTTRYLDDEWRLKWFPILLTFNNYTLSFDSHVNDDKWKTLDDFRESWKNIVEIHSK